MPDPYFLEATWNISSQLHSGLCALTVAKAYPYPSKKLFADPDLQEVWFKKTENIRTTFNIIVRIFQLAFGRELLVRKKLGNYPFPTLRYLDEDLS